MNRKEMLDERKSMFLKIGFFVFLLLLVSLLYIENHMWIDAAFLIILLTFLIRFLFVKLYQ